MIKFVIKWELCSVHLPHNLQLPGSATECPISSIVVGASLQVGTEVV